MFKKIAIYLSLLALAFTFSMALAAIAGEASPSACSRSAKTMSRACSLDLRDDYLTTIANCQNIIDRTVRRACKAEAHTVRAEEAESCTDIFDSRKETCEVLQEDRYDPDPLVDPANAFVHPDSIPDTYPENPYFSLATGHTYVLRAGEDGEETVVVHVTDETREIQGVECRIVADVSLQTTEEDGGIDYQVIEATDDLYAQDVSGNVFYCGETSRNFEDGLLRDLDGSFEAGRNFAKSGILIQAAPVPGMAHRQEFSLGEAEDIVQYAGLMSGPTDDEGGDNPAFPCNPGNCLKTFEYTPLEPDTSEFKYYRGGTGFVLGVSMENGVATGERDELVCVGDSLGILQDPECEIEDPVELLDELCAWSPDAFCDD